MDNRNAVWRHVDARKDRLIALSDRVWAMPEVCYTEARSCAEHVAELRHQGFRITEQVAGIPTAVMGEAGEGGPSSPSWASTTPCRASRRRRASPSIAPSRPAATGMAAATTSSARRRCWPPRR